MGLIEWSEKYSVGIVEIDNQHKGLVRIINELFDLISDGEAKENLNSVFEHLTDYINIHFKTEEEMLAKCEYAELSRHKAEHQKFIEKLDQLKNDFAKGKGAISLEILNFLKDWLLSHICISDKSYSDFIKACE